MALNNPYALSFDGVDDTVVASAIPLSQLSEWTAEFWIRSPRAPQLSTIISQPLVNDRTFAFSWDHKSSRGVQSVGYQYATSGGGQWYLVQIQEPLLAYTWYHIAATYDGDTLAIYLNGELDNSIDAPNPPVSIGYQMSIGAGLSGQSNFFRGDLDEVRIWNYARSAEEIYTYKNRYLTGNESGLLRLYRFDTGSGNIANDSSPNANHGTIYGATWVDGAVDLISATGHEKIASATAYGRATGTAKPYKIAFARATAQGAATAKAVILVLTIPKGVYNIDADNIFNRNQPITPDSLANYIEVWVNPLKPVAEPEEVYKTDEDDPFLIDANETKTVTIHYKKEPVAEVDIEFVNAPPYATIDSIKHYAWGANVTVTSPEAGTFELVATGKPLEVQGRELVVKKNETSILENGVKKYTFDNPFVQDRATAETIAEKLLAFATPQADIEIDWRGDPALALADSVLIPTFQRQGLDQREIFYVTKQELEYDGGLRAKLSGRKMEGGNG